MAGVVRIETADGIATVTLDDPATLNACGLDTAAALHDIVRGGRLRRGRGAVRDPHRRGARLLLGREPHLFASALGRGARRTSARGWSPPTIRS